MLSGKILLDKVLKKHYFFIILLLFCKFAFMSMLLKKIAITLLTLLTVLSTVSFTVEKHFCGNFLIDISFFGNANSCGGEKEEDCSDAFKSEKKSCCKDELTYIKGLQNVDKLLKEKTVVTKVVHAIWQTKTTHPELIFLQRYRIPFKNYTSPIITSNIQLLNMVFII